MDDPSNGPRVVVLGAGVNGAAVTRELILNGVSTWVIDANDISFGATSKSSRLIHGGLRYLEYGEFRLVRESLEERERLRRLAPHFVTPLRLYIPIESQLSGLATSALRFLGGSTIGAFQNLATKFRSQRGLWLVRTGLALYDRFAASREFPPHSVVRTGDSAAPALDSKRSPWMCAYSDAQMWGAERFTVALLEDARRSAADQSLEFRVLTHTTARWGQADLLLSSSNRAPGILAPGCVRPELVINATGAWGDRTLAGLDIPSHPLFGGTKGSHFLTWNSRLRDALRGNGVYAEASDGRLVFILPHGDAVLVGTTDERFEGPPEDAVASPFEIDYLVGMVNVLFPHAPLTHTDVAMHYSGVRPLPRSDKTTSAVSRDHSLARHTKDGIPVLTLVGGKLTTCRALGEQVADEAFQILGVRRTLHTRDRVLPGNRDYPRTSDARDSELRRLAGRFEITEAAARETWRLLGTDAEDILAAAFEEPGRQGTEAGPESNIAGTEIPAAIVRWIIRHEWAETLEDLVERRLMLVFRLNLAEETLRSLANCLVAEGRLQPEDVDETVNRLQQRLRTHYGRAAANERTRAPA